MTAIEKQCIDYIDTFIENGLIILNGRYDGELFEEKTCNLEHIEFCE